MTGRQKELDREKDIKEGDRESEKGGRKRGWGKEKQSKGQIGK